MVVCFLIGHIDVEWRVWSGGVEWGCGVEGMEWGCGVEGAVVLVRLSTERMRV